MAKTSESENFADLKFKSMFNLIPISLLIMALGGVVYIFSNHLSELEDDETNSKDVGFSFKTKFADFVNQIPLDNFKSQSLSITQKLLHRVRILLLKTDNRLMNLIGKISKKDKMINDNFWKDFSNQKQEVPEENIAKIEPEIKIDFAVKSNPIKIKISSIKPLKKSSKLKRQKK